MKHKVLITTLGVAYGLTLAALGAPQTVLMSALCELAMAAPGVFIVRAFTGAGWILPLTIGPIIGYGITSMVLLAFWAAGARGAWLLLAAPAIVIAASRWVREGVGRWRFPATERADARSLMLLLLVVPLVVARPFSLVGADTHAGEQVYRAYFTADYVWRRAVVSELAKGDFLPINPFYGGDSLHYYWLPHLANAIGYRATQTWANLDSLLLTHSVFVDAAFVAFLYGVSRWLGAGPAGAAFGVMCGLLFTSFEGAYALWEHLRVGASLDLLRELNVDALARWWLQGMPIDGLQRVLLYQPHHAVGYGLGFAGVLVIARRKGTYDPGAFAIGGTLLGVSVLVSSFGGLMLTVVAALHEAIAIVWTRQWRRAVAHAVAAAAPLGAAALLVQALQYVDRGGQVISIGFNPAASRNVVAASVLSFGPAAILSLAAAMIAWRSRRSEFLVLLALWVTCVVFYFCVDVRDHQNVYVGWRVGHLLFMGTAIVASAVWERVALLRRPLRRTALAAIALLLVVTAPTVVIDLYNTQDVTNTRLAPGFRWTLVISPQEREAFSWVKTHLPPKATVQVDPVPRGFDTWAYIPAFAERRMAVGLPISMVPLTKYQRGSAAIHAMLQLSNAEDMHAIARSFGVDYLFVAPFERENNPHLQTVLDGRPDLFPRMFSNGAVTVVQVAN